MVKGFAKRFSIHEIVLSGRFLGPYYPNILALGSTPLFVKMFGGSEFSLKRDEPKVYIFIQLWAPVSPEDGWNWKRYAVVGQNVCNWVIKYVKIKALSLPGKSTITFCNICELFLTGNRYIFQFCTYRSQKTFQKNFYWIFKFGCFSWYHTYI